VVMVALAGFSIVQDIRGRRVSSHEHSSSSTWFMLLPVLAVFLISPPALGVDVVNSGADTNRASSSSGFGSLPEGDVIPLSLTDFVTRTAWDSSGTLDGRTVRLTGFLARSGGDVHVARVAISCCAADARPLKVRLVGQPVSLPDEQWVEVTGRVVPGSAAKENSFVPSFTVADVRAVSEPAEPYES
jgi:uncharacterized repeat protein (TIGR03943 family)